MAEAVTARGEQRDKNALSLAGARNVRGGQVARRRRLAQAATQSRARSASGAQAAPRFWRYNHSQLVRSRENGQMPNNQFTT